MALLVNYRQVPAVLPGRPKMTLWGYVTSDFVVADWMQHPPAQVDSIIGGLKAKSDVWYITYIMHAYSL
jgi:hypothetical protein